MSYFFRRTKLLEEVAKASGNPWRDKSAKFTSKDKDEDGQAWHYTGDDNPPPGGWSESLADNKPYSLKQVQRLGQGRDPYTGKKFKGRQKDDIHPENMSSAQLDRIDREAEKDSKRWDAAEKKAESKVYTASQFKQNELWGNKGKKDYSTTFDDLGWEIGIRPKSFKVKWVNGEVETFKFHDEDNVGVYYKSPLGVKIFIDDGRSED